MNDLVLYNTLTRRKDRFVPLEPGLVRIYSCGPTVYSRQHLGNLRAYVFADLLNRSLRYLGYRVRHVINITDVGHLTSDADSGDDKMEKAARERKLSAREVADEWTRVFQADLLKLHCRPPDVWCKATDYIPEQIAMIRTLEEKGYTYRTSDGVYFDTSKDPHYGELAQIDVAAQATQERIERADEKRNPADFALWKLSPKGDERRQMEWDSPWGRGFPGWHIECSAMSVKQLGERFDIHTGGVDHIPVHHPNEIAQSEAALGVRPWVRYWLHGGWLMFDGAKLSKSTGGGVVNLDSLGEAGIAPLSYRYFLLGGHYRQQLTYSEDAIRGAQAARDRLVRHAVELREDASSHGADEMAAARERFRAAIADDLNAPRALAVAWEVARSDALGGREKWALLTEFDQVLALGLAEAEAPAQEVDAEVDALVAERDRARAAKNWRRADEIRDELKARGITVVDSPQGSRWQRG